jgi:hypothetical protein|tara:strand:+ start:1596 stop:1907 length:312 start_codon:yes stop_codon:yes gene_type:complete
MLTLQNREGLSNLMHVFSGKMRSMGVDIRWQEKKDQIIIHCDMGISNILTKALHYCFEDRYTFDHRGRGDITSTAPRLKLQPDDEIVHMYHKWQQRMERRNSF